MGLELFFFLFLCSSGFKYIVSGQFKFYFLIKERLNHHFYENCLIKEKCGRKKFFDEISGILEIATS